jgi:hypothetical protein
MSVADPRTDDRFSMSTSQQRSRKKCAALAVRRVRLSSWSAPFVRELFPAHIASNGRSLLNTLATQSLVRRERSDPHAVVRENRSTLRRGWLPTTTRLVSNERATSACFVSGAPKVYGVPTDAERSRGRSGRQAGSER